MKARMLTVTTALFVAALVGTAFAAVPDPLPLTWSESSVSFVLPDVPPPPRPKPTSTIGVWMARQPDVRASSPCGAPRAPVQRVVVGSERRTSA